MDIELLSREDFNDRSRGEPAVHFDKRGAIYFNKAAVKHLFLFEKGVYFGVSLYHDPKHPHDFFVMRDDDRGWQLRGAEGGGARFNSASLANHVIDTTWTMWCQSLAVGCVPAKPLTMGFRIARLPVDNDKNNNVYALIRKKV